MMPQGLPEGGTVYKTADLVSVTSHWREEWEAGDSAESSQLMKVIRDPGVYLDRDRLCKMTLVRQSGRWDYGWVLGDAVELLYILLDCGNRNVVM